MFSELSLLQLSPEVISGMIVAACVAGVMLIALLIKRIVSGSADKSETKPETTPETTSGVSLPKHVQAGSRSVGSRMADTKFASSHPVAAVADREATWVDRRLFADTAVGIQSSSKPLPRVAPDEIPHADTSDYLFGAATPALAALLPESSERRDMLKKELLAAGFYHPHAWHNLAAYRYMAVMGSMLLLGTMMILVPPRAGMAIACTMVGMCVMGWALPSLYVRNKAAERTSEIERAMPDMLDMLNMCVGQGLTVYESLRRVSDGLRGVYPALAQELTIVCEQAEIGTLQQALLSFSERIDVSDVHSFTSLLIQTERMGTSVSTALTEYSDNMREGLRQRADEKANRATFKLLFPTVLCLMPAVYMFLLGPAVIELSDFFNGGGRDILDAGRQAVEDLNR